MKRTKEHTAKKKGSSVFGPFAMVISLMALVTVASFVVVLTT